MDILNNDIEVDNNNEVMDQSRHRPTNKRTEKDHKSWDLYVYTIAMFINHFAAGLSNGLNGPTLVDLKYMLNTTMKLISISLIVSNLGYLSGSLFGLLYKYINRQLTVVVIMSAMAVSVALIPESQNLWTLYVFQYLNGLGAGIWDTANNVWLIEMWPHNSSPVLQFSQFMWGLGSVMGPILVRPYLTGETNHTQPMDTSLTTTPSAPVDRRALLRTPFLVAGLIQAFIPVVFLIMYFIKQYKSSDQRLKRKNSSESLLTEDLMANDDETDGQSVNDRRDSNHSLEMLYSAGRRLTIIGLFSAFLAIYSTLEVAHFSYSSTYYQNIALRLSAKTSAEILSVMCTSYTIGRCVSAFIAIKIGPQVMIIYHLLIIIIGMAVLYYGSHLLTLIWIGNIILGFGFSAMYSAIIALTAKHCKLTDTVSTVMVFTNGMVSAITPFILGPLIETNPFAFIELELVYLIISALVFVLILSVTRANRPFQTPGAYITA